MDNKDRDVLQVQIDGLKNEMHEFKQDVRAHLKETKESNRVYGEIITVMRENITKLTVLAEKQDEKLDLIHENINQKIDELKIGTGKNVRWYQNFFDKYFGNVLKILFVIILFLLGYKLTSTDLFGFIK